MIIKQIIYLMSLCHLRFSHQIITKKRRFKWHLVKKKHDFHLVDPSPWPIFSSFASLILAVGAVYYFHTKALWLMLIGTALLVYGAFMWFRDVIDEAEKQGHHTAIVQIGHRYGMTLFIASEVMFFVAWFWAFFNASLFPTETIGNVWPPA